MIPRTVAVATLSAMIGGLALTASAQPAGSGPPVVTKPGQMGQMGQKGQMGRPMHGHHGRFMGDPAERLKALRAEIGITEAQSAAWDAYAKVVQDTATRMRAAMGQPNRHAFMEMSTQDRLAYLTKRREAREQASSAVKSAADALLPVLDDTQKVRALMTLPGLAPPHSFMKHHAMARMPHGGPAATPRGSSN
jgi:hypothetical protein